MKSDIIFWNNKYLKKIKNRSCLSCYFMLRNQPCPYTIEGNLYLRICSIENIFYISYTPIKVLLDEIK
jgi:hypothetical protein